MTGLGSTTLKGRQAECAELDRLVEAVRSGESRALVVHGEAGIGKSALLAHVAEQAADCQVARAGGVQSEMELPFAALHQLCGSMLDHLDRLPPPQRDALETVFGVADGPVPDRFVVGLATLGPAVGGGGEAAVDVPDRRPPVAGPGVTTGPRLRCPSGRGRSRSVSSSRRGFPSAELTGTPAAPGQGSGGAGRAGVARLRAHRVVGLAGARPDRGRDTRQSAGRCWSCPGAVRRTSWPAGSRSHTARG